MYIILVGEKMLEVMSKKYSNEAGLGNVEVECAGENCCAQSNCGCDNARVSIFIASGEK